MEGLIELTDSLQDRLVEMDGLVEIGTDDSHTDRGGRADDDIALISRSIWAWSTTFLDIKVDLDALLANTILGPVKVR